MIFEDIIKAQEELEEINNEIIRNQQETIDVLKKEVDYLRAIIEKYVIKKPLS